MAVRIKDIAKVAKVSTATVSLALSNSTSVNINTKNRIKRIAKEMGYSPNPYAQRLVQKKSCMIGIVVPTIENIYYASLVQEVNNRVRKIGYGLTVAISENKIDNEKIIIEEMLNQQVEAILLAPVNIENNDSNYLKRLSSLSIPILFITSRYQNASGKCIMCNLTEGMQILYEYLHSKRCSKIILLSGPSGAYALDLRTNAAIETAKKFNINIEIVNLCDVTYEETYNYVLTKDNILYYDAITCVNDMMAIAALNALTFKGINVPNDISITGFDDVIFSQISHIPITTVRQDVKSMAKIALTKIEKALSESKVIIDDVIVPCDLIIRKST
jgi:LacI family transcriptional regulator